MSDYLINIGDLVSVPSKKVIGKVYDKYYNSNNSDTITISIDVDRTLTRNAYNDSKPYYIPNTIEVSYNKVKSLNPISIYNKKYKIIQTPNILTKKYIEIGNRVKFVDNYVLEKMLTYIACDRIYNSINLAAILNKEGTLTGNYNVLSNSVITVECEFKSYRYYIYMDSLQLVKRSKFIIRTWLKLTRNLKISYDKFLIKIFEIFRNFNKKLKNYWKNFVIWWKNN